jgi:hypothetical protein
VIGDISPFLGLQEVIGLTCFYTADQRLQCLSTVLDGVALIASDCQVCITLAIGANPEAVGTFAAERLFPDDQRHVNLFLDSQKVVGFTTLDPTDQRRQRLATVAYRVALIARNGQVRVPLRVRADPEAVVSFRTERFFPRDR